MNQNENFCESKNYNNKKNNKPMKNNSFALTKF